VREIKSWRKKIDTEIDTDTHTQTRAQECMDSFIIRQQSVSKTEIDRPTGQRQIVVVLLGYFGVVLQGCEGWLGRQDQPKDGENPKESARQRNCSEIPASHPRLRPQLPLCACYPTACVSDDHARHDHADPGVISIALSFCVLARDHLLCILHPTTSGSLYAALQGNGGNLFGSIDVHSKSERRKRNAGATWRDSASFTFAQAWGNDPCVKSEYYQRMRHLRACLNAVGLAVRTRLAWH